MAGLASERGSPRRFEYLFNFDNTFEIHDDIEVLKRMGMACGLESGSCSAEDLKVARSLVPKALEPYVTGQSCPVPVSGCDGPAHGFPGCGCRWPRSCWSPVGSGGARVSSRGKARLASRARVGRLLQVPVAGGVRGQQVGHVPVGCVGGAAWSLLGTSLWQCWGSGCRVRDGFAGAEMPPSCGPQPWDPLPRVRGLSSRAREGLT